MAERDTETTGLQGSGSQHRAMVMFCDLVGSTELSGRHEPERYGLLVRRYIAEVRTTIEDRFGGYVAGEVGDGLVVLFGAFHAHGDDAERAVHAALELLERVRALSVETERDLGEALAVRIGLHRGPIYRSADGAIYGLTVNVAARLQSLASTNTVVISDEVRRMVEHRFDTEAKGPHLVKGVEQPVQVHSIVGERVDWAPRQEPRRSLIDRALEWKRLHAAWDGVRSGHSAQATALLLRGEAGVGKSHLVSRVAGLAADEGAVVVEMTGSAVEDSGLYPVRRLIERSVGLRRGAGGPERLQRLRDDLTRRGLSPDIFVPRLAPILGLEPAAGYVAEPADARKLNENVLHAACEYVNTCLGDSPSVLLFEDIQWYDESTRELMSRLARRKEASLLLMTARPGAEGVEEAEVIDLEPFSEQDSGRLIDALCDQEPMTAEIRLDVVARSDGIPLYIEELVANVQRGLPSPPDRSTRSSGTVPDLLYDLLVARLASDVDVIPVASAAAVIGRDIDRRLLQHLLGLSHAELDIALETLCEEGVLEHPFAKENQYRFRHELLREVAYELQPPSRRRYVHERVANALVTREANGGVADWGVIASHFEEAERWVESADAYERAASAARGRGAFSEARRYVSTAIELLEAGDEGPERDTHEVKLRLQRGYLAVSEEGHASPAAAADYDRCLELAAADPLGDEMFETVIVLWTYHLIRGEIAQARQISESTYRTLERREWYRSFNLAAFGILECFEGDFSRARDRLEEFMGTRVHANEQRFVSEWFNPNEPVTGILTAVALVRFVTGDLTGAEGAFHDALERAESMQFPQGPYSVAYALSLEAWMRLELEQFDQAQNRISLLGEIAGRHGFDAWSMVAVTQQTVLAATRALHDDAADGQLTEHASSLRVMTDVWKQFDTRFFLPYYLMTAGVLYGAAGDEHDARACLEDSLSLATETGMNFWRAETLRHLALLDLHPKGRHEGLRESLSLARSQRASVFELRTALDLTELGDGAGGADIEWAVDQLGGNASYPEVARAEAVLAALE